MLGLALLPGGIVSFGKAQPQFAHQHPAPLSLCSLAHTVQLRENILACGQPHLH
ncbi:hypothetical protein D3C75_1295580 [compost metagenome]